jgi:chromate reductase
MYNVAVIVGSVRKDSLNRRVARALARLGGDSLRLSEVRIDDLPFYDPELEADVPAPAARLRAEVAAADAVLFVTPEYNRSIPGVLKNAIDWGSRPYNKGALKGKPGAIAGASPGAIGTGMAQAHLRSILPIVDVRLLTVPDVYLTINNDLVDLDGKLANESTQAFLTGFLQAFAGWIALLKGASAR